MLSERKALHYKVICGGLFNRGTKVVVWGSQLPSLNFGGGGFEIFF